MNLPEHKLICTRPFEWFEVHPEGSVFLCCPAWLKRPIGNLLQQSIEEIWNGPVAREIRKSMFNGSFHNCSYKRCPHLLNRSVPVCHAEQLEPRISKAIAKQTSTLPFPPSQLNLCFDLSCNLACPSCRADIQQAKGADLARTERISAIVLRELIPQAKTVILSGFGDPFGSPTYLKLLRQLNRRNYPRLEQVHLHTNGQLLTEQMWQSLPGLQPLVTEIEISIDAATEKTYQFNRPGGSFNQLLQNLEFLSSTETELTLSMVIQENNWREIPQLVELARQFAARIYLSQLVNWGTFSRAEFLQRAVHLPGHPEHLKVRELLQKINTETQNISSNLPFLS